MGIRRCLLFSAAPARRPAAIASQPAVVVHCNYSALLRSQYVSTAPNRVNIVMIMKSEKRLTSAIESGVDYNKVNIVIITI